MLYEVITAGVLLAFTIPAKARINTKRFSEKTEELLNKFEGAGEHGENVLSNETRQTDVMAIEENCKKILTPLQRFEHSLHPWSSFLIMPLFALRITSYNVCYTKLLRFT